MQPLRRCVMQSLPWGGQNLVRYTAAVRNERGQLMPTPSLQAKKAYYAKARQSNYAASLRLEGFDVTPADAERKLPSRESVLSAYRARQD